MEKLKMQTPNLVDKNVEQIARLFPNVVTETRDENGNLKRRWTLTCSNRR